MCRHHRAAGREKPHLSPPPTAATRWLLLLVFASGLALLALGALLTALLVTLVVLITFVALQSAPPALRGGPRT